MLNMPKPNIEYLFKYSLKILDQVWASHQDLSALNKISLCSKFQK